MAAQSKLELILELKNRMKTSLSKAKEQLSGSVNEMKGKLGELKEGHVKAFNAMQDEIPGLQRGMELLANPYVALTAVVLALGTMLWKGVEAAGAFEHQFLELKNLNLDKTQDQVTDLKGNILDLSLKLGLAATDTSKAFFDVQSGTGKFGEEVDQIVEKVGKFSIATKSDLGESINSSIKAMRAWGFGAAEMDRYLESNAKTVQVGIVTFDQLSRVQTEYAGSAAAIGQSFDTANKVFAAFTATAKNADIAANLTKSAFEGLTQASTIKGLEKIGVKMYDANNQLKDVDQIIAELVPKFKGMSDMEFHKLLNEIGGPEGLRGLLNQVKTGGDELLKTFDAFDNTNFDIEEALKNAKGDFYTMKEIVGNQLNNMLVRLGELILPTIVRALGWVSDTIVYIYENWEKFRGVAVAVGTTIGVLAAIFFPIPTLIAAMVAGLVYFYDKSLIIRSLWEGFKSYLMNFVDLIAGIGDMISGAFSFDTDAIVAGAKRAGLAFAKTIGGYAGIEGAVMHYMQEKGQASENSAKKKSSLVPEGDLDDNKKKDLLTDDKSDKDTKVVGDASKSRNITINIGALHKGDNHIHNKEMPANISWAEFERWYSEMLLRQARNVEGSL